MLNDRPIRRQTRLLAPNVKESDFPETMSLAQMEKHLVRKHYLLELDGNPSAAKVLDQIMKVKEMRQKERQYALEEEAAKVKPTIAVIPLLEDYESWKAISAKQQEELISETVKV